MVNFFGNFSHSFWRVSYEACIPLEYGDPIHRWSQKINRSIPGIKLFAIKRPRPDLRKRWHRALVKILNDLGNVQIRDTLSVGANLLLNCHVETENGGYSHGKRRLVD